MANKDWIATIMYNNPQSLDDMVAHGVTPENTDIQNIDYYKNKEEVRNNEAFQTDGKFDENKFENFYDSALNMYNQFSNEDWTSKLIDNMAIDPFDYSQPFKTDIKDISAVIQTNAYNPDRRSNSITGIGFQGDPTLSVREVAQNNYVRDQNGNKLDWTPNQHSGIYKSILDPVVAIAIWDEDTDENINGEIIHHNKGDYKVDENGDFYYEVLGTKESYNRDVLRWTDTLTVDGSTMNKFDFLDSDGLTKSVGGTLMKTAATLTPFLIPGANTVFGALGVLYGLASIAPTLGKAINGIITNDNSNEFGKGATKIENWFQKFSSTQSDEAREKGFVSLENITEILGSSASQLYSQKVLGNISYSLAKMNNVQRASKLGRNLSLGFMAITSSEQAYSDFKNAGASDAAAGIGMLASIAALYGLMTSDYFRDQLFKGTVLDESEAVDVIKNYTEVEGKPIIEAISGGSALSKKQAVNLFNQLYDGIKNRWKSFLSKPISGVAQQTMASDTKRKAFSNFGKIINRAFNEGAEETMEEVSTDLVKSLFAGANALGINVKSKEAKDLDFGFDAKSIAIRYGENFLGGFLGGAVFEGLNQYERFFGPKIVQLSDLTANDQLMYMIGTGRTKELQDRLKVLYQKGMLGDENLSATKTRKNSKGETIYEKGTETNNQNLLMYQVIRNSINYISNTINDFGINIMYGDDFLDKTDLVDAILGNKELSDLYKKNLEHQKEEIEDLGISDNEYLNTNKTNALLETIKQYKFHTSYLDDIKKLSAEYLKTKADLDELLQTKPGTSTEDEKKTEAENLKNQKNIEYLTKKVKMLEELRDSYIEHRHDDRYADQVLYMVSKKMQDSFRKVINTDGKQEDTYWKTSIDNYTQSIYRKNFNDLSEFEKEDVKREYNRIKSNDVDQLKYESDLHYKLIEQMSPKLKELDSLLKDLKESSYYKHGILAVSTYDFKDYENNMSQKIKLSNELKQITNKDTAKTNEIEQSVLSEDRFKPLKDFTIQAILDEQEAAAADGRSPEIDKNINDLYTEYLNEVQSKLNNDKKHKDYINQINLDQRLINELDQKISKFNKSYNYNTDVVTDSITEEGKSNYAEPIYNAINNLINFKNHLTSLNARGNDAVMDISAELNINVRNRDELETYINDNIKIERENIINKLVEYYSNLKDNKIISENDNVLKSVLATVFEEYINADKFNSAFDDYISIYNIEDEKSLSDFRSKFRNAIVELYSGNININDLNNLKEFGNTISAGLFDDLIYNFTGWNNLIKDLDKIQKLKNETPSFGVIELLRKFNLGIGKDVISVIDLLNKEESSLIAKNDINKYIITNPAYDAALRNIPRIMDMLESLISPLVNGYSTVLNQYRKKGYSEPLIENISDSTRNILSSDIQYLKNKAIALITISDKNRTQQLSYHKDSEKINKAELINSLFVKPSPEVESFADSIKTKSGGKIDIKTIVNEIFENDIPSEVNDENIQLFTKNLFRFASELYNKAKNSGFTDEQLGSFISESLISSSINLDSGEYSNDPNRHITNMSTAYFLAGMMSTDFSKIYKISDEVYKDEKDVAPLWSQKISQIMAVSAMTNFGIFNAVTDGIKGKVKDYISENQIGDPKYFENLSTIKNILFLKGGPGTGKTWVIDKFIVKTIKKLDDKAEFVVCAPEKSQLDNLKKATDTDDKHAVLLEDLLNKICPKKPSYQSSESTLHAAHYNEVDIKTVGTDAELYTNGKNKYMIIDEATFASEGDLQILSKWAVARNVKILLTGDLKQNGKIVEFTDKNGNTGKTLANIDDCIIATLPELTAVIRSENIAVQNNTIAAGNLAARYETAHRKDRKLSLDEIVKEVKDPFVSLQYYEDKDSFVGCRILNSSVDINHYISEFSKLVGNNTVAIITDNPNKYSSIPGTYNNIVVLDSNSVQGGEFDYVIVDKNFNSNNPTLYNKAMDFNTMISRAKKGIVINNQNDTLEGIVISNELGDRTLLETPTLIANNLESLKEWDSMVNQWTTEEAKPLKKDNASKDSIPEEGDKEGEDDKGGNGTESEDKDTSSEEEDVKGGIADNFFNDILDDKNDDSSGVLAPEETPEEINSKIDRKLDNDKAEDKLNARLSSINKDNTVSRTRVNNTKKISSNSGPNLRLYDRKAFIDELNSPKTAFWETEQENNYSIKSKFSDELNYKEFIRYFSSAVMIGMGLGPRHIEKLTLMSNITEDFATRIATAWNTMADSDYYIYCKKVIGPQQRSIIYLPLTVDSENYLIPIGTFAEVIQGKYLVKQGYALFDIAKACEQKTMPENGFRNIENLPYGQVMSSAKIFAASESDGQFGDNSNPLYAHSKCYNFFKDNHGKSFTVWTPVDILTDEDLEQVFRTKQDKTNRTIWYTDVELRQNEAFTKRDFEYQNKKANLKVKLSNKEISQSEYQKELKSLNDEYKDIMSLNPEGTNSLLNLNGNTRVAKADGTSGDKILAPVKLMEAHRIISLEDLVNTVAVVKFITGSISYGNLTEAQKNLFDGKTRTSAINYMKTILGDFEYNLSAEGIVENQTKVNAENLRKLRTKYRLLVDIASKRFLNAVLYAFNDPTINTNNKLTTQLDENLLSLIQRTVTSKSGVGNVNRIGFKITFNGGTNPSHTYFVKYNQSTQNYDIYSKLRENDRDVPQINAYENSPIASVSAAGLQIGEMVKSRLDSIIKAINNTNANNSSKQEFTLENLRNSNIIIELESEVTRPNKSIGHYTLSDYDIIYNCFKKVPISSYTQLENIFKKGYFKNGITLNDASSIIENRRETTWADLRVNNTTETNRVSNIQAMLPPVFKANISSEDLTEVNDEAELFGIINEDKSNNSKPLRGDISIFKKNVVSSYEDNVGVTTTIESIFPFDFEEEWNNLSDEEFINYINEQFSKNDIPFAIISYNFKTGEIMGGKVQAKGSVDNTVKNWLKDAGFENAKNLTVTNNDKEGIIESVSFEIDGITYEYVMNNGYLINKEALNNITELNKYLTFDINTIINDLLNDKDSALEKLETMCDLLQSETQSIVWNIIDNIDNAISSNSAVLTSCKF